MSKVCPWNQLLSYRSTSVKTIFRAQAAIPLKPRGDLSTNSSPEQ